MLFHIDCVHAGVLAGRSLIGEAMATFATASCMALLCKRFSTHYPLHIAPHLINLSSTFFPGRRHDS